LSSSDTNKPIRPDNEKQRVIGEQEEARIDLSIPITHHALSFGASAQAGAASKMVMTLTFGPGSANMVCRTLDDHSFVCVVPLGSETIEFPSFDFFHR
jgi:hypothetical protein